MSEDDIRGFDGLSDGQDASDDQDASVVALAPIAFRRSAARETIRGYWQDVHGPAMSRVAGLAWYDQHHLEHDRGDNWPVLPGICHEISADEQLDGVAELGFVSDDGADRFSQGASVSRALEDDRNFVHRGTVQRSTRGNSKTLVNRLSDQTPLGPTAECGVMVALRSRADVPRSIFNEVVLTMAEKLSGHPLLLKLRYVLVEDYHLADWPAENVLHPPIDHQFQAFVELRFKSRLAMQLCYSSSAFTAAVSGVEHAIGSINAFPIMQTVCFVHQGRRTLAGEYGATAARHIADTGATLRWNSELAL